MTNQELNQEREKIAVAQLTSQLAKILTESSEVCVQSQEIVSKLLEKTHHPSIVDEVHALQNLDRLSQTLEQIATITHAISEAVSPSVTLDAELIADSLTLDSVKARVFRTSLEESASCGTLHDIIWFE